MFDIQFSIDDVIPPFNLELTAWALRRRPVNEIDQWDGETYSRVLEIRQKPVLIKVNQSGGSPSPRLHVHAVSERKIQNLKPALMPVIAGLLGLNVNLKPFYRMAEEDARLAVLAARFNGLKPPRFPSVFEALVNAVACQQLSLHVGLTLINRLAVSCGLPIEARRSFPTVENVANISMTELRAAGFSRNKALALQRLAQNKDFLSNSFSDMDERQILSQLLELRGVGRWTAEYTLLRGLGRLHVFPGDDVGARNNLKRWLGLRRELDYAAVDRRLSRWQPFAGLIYFHLLLDGLERAGDLQRTKRDR